MWPQDTDEESGYKHRTAKEIIRNRIGVSRGQKHLERQKKGFSVSSNTKKTLKKPVKKKPRRKSADDAAPLKKSDSLAFQKRKLAKLSFGSLPMPDSQAAIGTFSSQFLEFQEPSDPDLSKGIPLDSSAADLIPEIKNSVSLPERKTAEDPRASKTMRRSHSLDQASMNKLLSPDSDDPESVERKASQYYFGRRLHNFKLPKNLPSDNTLLQLPDQELNLYHMYGFKGDDPFCRNNLHVLWDNKSVIFNKSNVVVLHNLETSRQKFFKAHTREVTAIAPWPNKVKQLVASGQLADTELKGKNLILVWDSCTLQVLRRFENDCRSICSLQFSAEFKLVYGLGTDDDHQIKGYSLSKKTQKSKREKIGIVTSKSLVYGFVCKHSSQTNMDVLVVFGQKLLKYIEVHQDNKGALTYKSRTVRTTSGDARRERAFHGAVFLNGENESKYIAGGQTGHIYLCEKTQSISRVQAHQDPILALTVANDGFITCGAQGRVNFGTVKKSKIVVKCQARSLKNHESIRHHGATRAVTFNQKTQEIILGLKSNQLVTIPFEGGEPTVVAESHSGGINAVACHQREPWVATGSEDGTVRLWDYEERSSRPSQFHAEDKGHVKSLLFSPDGHFLVAGYDTPRVLFFHLDPFELAGECTFRLKSEATHVNALTITPDNSVLAVGFSNGSIRMCTIQEDDGNIYGLEWASAMKTTSAVLDLQFTLNFGFLRAFTKDYAINNFRVMALDRLLEPYTDPIDTDIHWFGKPLRAGWDVRGLYQPGFDGSYLLAVGKSQNGVLVAAGDRKGVLRIHNYPALVPEAHIGYKHHAGALTGVAFSKDDSYVFTISSDGALMQWEVLGEMTPAFTEVEVCAFTPAPAMDGHELSDYLSDMASGYQSGTELNSSDYLPVTGSNTKPSEVLPEPKQNLTLDEMITPSGAIRVEVEMLPDIQLSARSLAVSQSLVSHRKTLTMGQLQSNRMDDRYSGAIGTWDEFIGELQDNLKRGSEKQTLQQIAEKGRLKLSRYFESEINPLMLMSAQSDEVIEEEEIVLPSRPTFASDDSLDANETRLPEPTDERLPELVDKLHYIVGDTCEGRIEDHWVEGTIMMGKDGVYLFQTEDNKQELLTVADLRRPRIQFVLGEDCLGKVGKSWVQGKVTLELKGIYLFKYNQNCDALLEHHQLRRLLCRE